MSKSEVATKSTRVAVVTAGSRGIGAACAQRLAESGYRLVLMSRSDGCLSLARNLGGVALRGSVTELNDLEALVALAMETYGHIDAVVNNTGDPPKPTNGDLLAVSDETWHENIDLLVLNVARMARLVTPIMIAQGSGSIVNISAADAYEPDAQFAIGSVLRAALGAFTKLYANQHAGLNIRMNCVLPGITLDQSTGEVREDIRDEVPMGRPASYREVANVVAILLSDLTTLRMLQDRAGASTVG